MGTSYAEMMAETGPPPPADELQVLYEEYAAEGHLTRSVCFTPEDREQESWMLFCTCGESSAWDSIEGPRAGEPIIQRTAHDAKWWGRGHRNEHGLSWQQWQPVLSPNEFYAGIYRQDSHCVVGGPMEGDEPGAVEWMAWCTCTEEAPADAGPEFMEGRAWKTSSETEILELVAEHRRAHGLSAQVELIHPAYIYAPPAEAGEL